MTDEQLAELVRYGRASLAALDVPRPSRAAQLEQARRIVAAGRGLEAGLASVSGVVAVRVLDGEAEGWLRGDAVLDVLVDADTLDVDVRLVVARSLGSGRRVLVRVRVASRLDELVAWVRWVWVRRRVERAINRLQLAVLGPS